MSTQSCPDDSLNRTDCPAAGSDFDFSPYLDICRTCIAGNADVAGLGIITGIFLQVLLMNVFVILWWWGGLGRRLVCEDLRSIYAKLINPLRHMAVKLFRKENATQSSQIEAQAQDPYITMEGPSGHSQMKDPDASSPSAMHPINIGDGVKDFLGDHIIEGTHGGVLTRDMDFGRVFREKVQEMFQQWSDIQAVTGIALLLAAIIQGNCLSLYHTAIVLDLISVAADGQAIMLLYAHIASTGQIGDPDPWIKRALIPRLISSLVFIALYFYFAFNSHERYRMADDECFLSSKPRTGNYGAWGIATATLVFVVYIYAFMSPKIRRALLTYFINFLSLSRITTLPPFLVGSAVSEGKFASKSGKKSYFARFAYWTGNIIMRTKRTMTALVLWTHKRELTFLLGTWAYFLWNMTDIITLKITNKALLVNGGAEEHNFGSFGQIVPIVMVAALCFPIYDTLSR